MAELTDSGSLFQRDGAQECSTVVTVVPVLVLSQGTDRLMPLFDLSERDGSDMAGME